MNELAARLRAHPEGDLTLAVGPVALGLGAFIAFTRMNQPWADFPLLLVLVIPSAFLLLLALSAGTSSGASGDGFELAPWQTACLLTAIPLLAASMLQLVVMFGNDDPGSGPFTCILLLTGAIAAALSLRYSSPGVALLASVALAAAIFVGVNWVDSDAPSAAYRDVALIEGLIFLALARVTWQARRRAVQFAAIGAALLIGGALLANSALNLGFFGFGSDSSFEERKDGWTFVLVAVSIGIAAFGAWQRHGASALVGLGGIYFFYATNSFGGNLSGWPLLLGIAAVLCFGWALVVRPARSAAGSSSQPPPPPPPPST